MLIGFVKWEFYERERGEEESRKEEEEEIDWCEGRTKELAELFLGKTYGLRRRIWGGKRHACESLFPVFPFRASWDGELGFLGMGSLG